MGLITHAWVCKAVKLINLKFEKLHSLCLGMNVYPNLTAWQDLHELLNKFGNYGMSCQAL
jgi:hypothetical protein